MSVEYDKRTGDYDKTRQPDSRIAEPLIKLLDPNSTGLYLDLACGTGNYTTTLANQGYSFCGVDQSEKMLAVARQKSSDIDWRLANVENMPFDDNTFDGIICTLAIHLFNDINDIFPEAARVLKPGGRIVLFTAWAEQMHHYWLNHYFPIAMERSTEEMPREQMVKDALRQAGLRNFYEEPFFVPPDLKDLFLYGGKHRPEIYFDPEFRDGISTFRSLIDPDELETGLEKLKTDVETSAFKKIAASYENENGDYIFLTAEKNH